MSIFTSIWSLLKKDPVTDGDDMFNIETMLNDNWDKLDAAVGLKAANADVRAATIANVSLIGLQTVDGVTLALGDRILVKNQTAAKDNGIYVVSDVAWSRSPDADSAVKLAAGAHVYVREGSANAGTGWSLSFNGAIELGTTELTFAQKSGNGSATDAVIGARSPDPNTPVAYGTSGTVTQLFSWILKYMKAITGKSNSFDAPDTTLAAAKAHADATAPHSGHAIVGRKVSGSGGLQGGGDLSADRTLSIASEGVTDAHLGTRTVDDTVVAAAGADTPTRLWSKLGNMIKAITGKSNWYTPPATTLEDAKTHIDASAPHAGHAAVGRMISTTGGLQGGGDLSANRTLSIASSGVTDAHFGTRTVDDTVAATSGADTPTRLWSKLGYMIMAITGKSNWYTAPATTLEAAKMHMDAAAPHTGHAVVGRTISATGGLQGGGDLSADRTLSIATGGITNTHINTAAEIDAVKIGAGTVSNSEFGYLNGVTSAIQTQLNSKLASSGNAVSASKLATTRTLSLTGDATASMAFDGSANASGSLALASTGVSAGTYKSVAVDTKGRVTAGTNPTTLSGYGITDATPASHLSDYTSHVPYASASGSANSYTVLLSPAPASLSSGLALAVKINVANTGSSTINVNGLGAKSILTSKGGALTSGKMVANGVYTLRYNGTAFILQGEGGEYGTASAPQVLSGYTVGTENGIVSGTMANNGTLSYVPGASSHAIPAGYTSGGTVAAVANLSAANIKSGTTVGGVVGTFTSDATATAAQILNGQTAYSGGTKVTGTMPNNGALSYTPGTSVQTIPSGYTSGGNVAAVSNLSAANIKYGVTVGGVAGSFTNDATAGASQILSGYTAYNDGAKVTGAIPNIGSLGTIVPGTNAKSIVSGYTSGGIVAGDSNLIASNIKNGVSIFGVTGSYTAKRYASGLTTLASSKIYYSSNGNDSRNVYYITVSGLAFSPKIITIYINSSDSGFSGFPCTAYNDYSPSFNGNKIILGVFYYGFDGWRLPAGDLTSNGFTMPVSSSGTDYLWYAFE